MKIMRSLLLHPMNIVTILLLVSNQVISIFSESFVSSLLSFPSSLDTDYINNSNSKWSDRLWKTITTTTKNDNKINSIAYNANPNRRYYNYYHDQQRHLQVINGTNTTISTNATSSTNRTNTTTITITTTNSTNTTTTTTPTTTTPASVTTNVTNITTNVTNVTNVTNTTTNVTNITGSITTNVTNTTRNNSTITNTTSNTTSSNVTTTKTNTTNTNTTTSTTNTTNSNTTTSSTNITNTNTTTSTTLIRNVTLPFRINCGNTTGDYNETTTGKVWLRDNYFTFSSQYNGCTRAASYNISSITPKDCLTRTNTAFTYDIPVPLNGAYTITLWFTEVFFNAPMRRMFNVSIENNPVITNLDPYVAGNNTMYTPFTRKFTNVSVTDGRVTIRFAASVNKAIVSAIEIEQYIPPVPLSTIRINSGAFVPYNDIPTLTNWSSDTFFTRGFRFSNCPANISNTDLDTLYCSERNWYGPPGTNGTYNIPVVPGRYSVRLLFAELYFTKPKQRVFNISLQNTVIRSNFDIVALAGAINTSYIFTTSVNVTTTDPFVRIQFTNVINNAKISAIEIIGFQDAPAVPTTAPIRPPTLAPTGIPTFSFYYINCGADQVYVDTVGKTWRTDQYFLGGMTSSISIPIANTDDDNLFQYQRAGDSFSYSLPVPVGSYEVTLYFAETEFNATNQRLFDVTVENVTQSNIDIFKLAGGANIATRIIVYRVVEDGVLNIEFTRAVGSSASSFPKINAIEVELDKPHVAHAVASGPYIATVIDNSTGAKAAVRLIGETSHTHGEGLDLVRYEWKEGLVQLGNASNVNYNFTVGNHTIALTVKDSGGFTDNEVTNVFVRPFGFPAITSLVPDSGALAGLYNVTIFGSGFNYSSSQITVRFGQTTFTGSNVTVLNSTAIRVRAPPSGITQAVGIVITTPIGVSTAYDFNYVSAIPISWMSGSILNYYGPTVGQFGPDQKLYVGTRKGRILKVTMNANYTAAINVIVSLVNVEEEAVLGLVFDPMDVKSDPDVYFTASKFFHQGNMSSSGSTINGRIRRASGPNLESVTEIITGLPVSDLDHALNSLEFGDNGELYFTSGSHTNGGIPGAASSSKILKENFLSAAVSVAYLSHPDFNGTIRWSAPDDGNMIAKGIDVFAHGVRNSFTIVLHSNGRLYATDNGPNVGYGPMSTGCGPTDFIDDAQRDDKILLLQKGNYYGHPNFKRAAYFNDPRQCVWYPPESNNTNVTAPLTTYASSTNGIIEYHSNHFGGQLRSNLLMLRYQGSASIIRIVLNNNGTALIPSLNRRPLRMNIGFAGLSLTQAPNGNLIEFKYYSNDNSVADTIFYHSPVEPRTNALVAKTCFPRRGRNAGGGTLSVYGVNFLVNGPTVNVTVGGANCPVTSVTASRVDCTLPGGNGTVDIVVRNGAASSTFERGYRYITGLPPPGFVLPVYSA